MCAGARAVKLFAALCVAQRKDKMELPDDPDQYI